MDKNYDYFSKIDTEYKAYILGFIYADGSISIKKGNRQRRLTISIQEEDSYILKKLLYDTNSNNILITNSPSKKSKGWKPLGNANISSDRLCNDLENLGCLVNKTNKGMIFPILEEFLIPHFIRGFFDGDGCITYKVQKYQSKKGESKYFSKKIAFSSTDEKFLDKLCSFLPIGKIYKTKRLRKKEVFTYWIERVQDTENVKNYFYNNANYFLERKYNKFNMTIKSQAKDTSLEGLETT